MSDYIFTTPATVRVDNPAPREPGDDPYAGAACLRFGWGYSVFSVVCNGGAYTPACAEGYRSCRKLSLLRDRGGECPGAYDRENDLCRRCGGEEDCPYARLGVPEDEPGEMREEAA
jgi:hypothetical protein